MKKQPLDILITDEKLKQLLEELNNSVEDSSLTSEQGEQLVLDTKNLVGKPTSYALHLITCIYSMLEANLAYTIHKTMDKLFILEEDDTFNMDDLLKDLTKGDESKN
jgi:hypothetical protein